MALAFMVGVAALCACAPAQALLALGALLASDFARLNLREARLPPMCPCFGARGGLGARLGALSDALDRLAEDPHKISVSVCAHMVGAVLGWFCGRPYLRFTLDTFCLEYAEEVALCSEGACVRRCFGGALPANPECRGDG